MTMPKTTTMMRLKAVMRARQMRMKRVKMRSRGKMQKEVQLVGDRMMKKMMMMMLRRVRRRRMRVKSRRMTQIIRKG